MSRTKFGRVLKQLRTVTILGVDQQVVLVMSGSGSPGQGSMGYGLRTLAACWLATRYYASGLVSCVMTIRPLLRDKSSRCVDVSQTDATSAIFSCVRLHQLPAGRNCRSTQRWNPPTAARSVVILTGVCGRLVTWKGLRSCTRTNPVLSRSMVGRIQRGRFDRLQSSRFSRAHQPPRFYLHGIRYLTTCGIRTMALVRVFENASDQPEIRDSTVRENPSTSNHGTQNRRDDRPLKSLRLSDSA